jgi:TRAP-type uncharacterized transport system fused permease subunit
MSKTINNETYEDTKSLDNLPIDETIKETQSSNVISSIKQESWFLVFLVSLTLGLILFGFGLSSIVGYTLNRKKMSSQTMTQEQVEELYSELRSSVLLFLISVLLLIIMLFTGYKKILSLM